MFAVGYTEVGDESKDHIAVHICMLMVFALQSHTQVPPVRELSGCTQPHSLVLGKI